MELKDALRLSIKKWEYVIKKGGAYSEDDIVDDMPELKDLEAYCGLCNFFISKTCRHCPLNDMGFNCCREYHFWLLADIPQNKLMWAEKLLKRLKKVLKDISVDMSGANP